ncbi:MAG: hotdog fold thioesterase [Saccharolobus sp.]|uniref:Acyl-CoA thioesterase n=2 Tax=Saccharolobus shibatae TaxID=2286 RepID=A0A8F5BZI7_9CREN|nr:hotdog fold thioesterase [Saccharolobus shibatae]MCH4816061.1 PaaI family thioesterase [Saccharolobus shibatae]QXJ28004.1 Acyl-CoA thioesterase [Saccharolobus shibatae B12]QXJ31324.1 Acyl-CoA thioesterase [Saccharolobus shibatae]QXJ34342.1 Acyl-CoA thioesterase [Saccharolobus shibatae]
MLKESPFLKFLDIELEEIREGYARVSGVITKDFLNVHNTAHGSFIFAIADAAFEYASNFTRDSVALHMDIDFRRPVKEGEKVIAEAFEESTGKTTSLYRIIVKNEEGKLVAYVTALVFHIDNRREV